MSQTRLHKPGDVIKRADGGKNLCIALTTKECMWLTQEGKLYRANLKNQYPLFYTVDLPYQIPHDVHIKDLKKEDFKYCFEQSA